MNFTHERRSRKAVALQWDGTNTDAVTMLLAKHKMIGNNMDVYIMVRKNGYIVHTLHHGHWLFEGEDGILRFQDDEKFKSMYQPINDELERLRGEIERLKALERQGLENFNLLLEAMNRKAHK